jgi:hypothetical protein
MMKTRLAMTALLTAATSVAACGDLQKRADFSVGGLAYAPDGTLVVFTNGGIFMYDDPRLETEKGRILLQGVETFRGLESYRYSLSADGTVAAVAYSQVSSESTTIALYSIPTGAPLKMLETMTGYPFVALQDLALSPHGDLVVANPSDFSGLPLTTIDAATGTAWSIDQKFLPVWSRDGATLYVLGSESVPAVENTLFAYSAAGDLKWSQPLSRGLLRLAMVGGGETLAAMANLPDCAVNGGTCQLLLPFWSGVDGTLTAEVPVPANVSGLLGVFTCSATDDVCAVQLSKDFSMPPWLQIYRPDGTIVATLSTGAAYAVALSPDGQFVAVSGPDAHDVAVFRIADGTRVGSHVFTAELL